MKFRTSDPRIKDAFEIAKGKNIKYEFIKKNLGPKWHPNTVKIVLERGKYKMSVIGSSIGGGMIEILKIDNFNVKIKGRAGKYLSLVACYDRDHRILNKIINKIKEFRINVAETVNTSYRDKTLSVVSLEGRRILLPEVLELEQIKGVDFVRALSKLQKQQ
jgi:L-serine dehydratase